MSARTDSLKWVKAGGRTGFRLALYFRRLSKELLLSEQGSRIVFCLLEHFWGKRQRPKQKKLPYIKGHKDEEKICAV